MEGSNAVDHAIGHILALGWSHARLTYHDDGDLGVSLGGKIIRH